MVHSDTSNGFWTLDPVVYVVSASSDLFEGKIFEFGRDTITFELSNLKNTIPLGNYRD